ncbi:MerR family transcriptional regulator [Magnetococcales bacterium HHB-1]
MAAQAQQADNPTDGMVKIGVVAQHLGISIRTIHMYEREGLFIAYKNSAGTRYFSPTDIKWLEEVRALIKSGVSIVGIRRLLSLMPCWESKKCHHKGREECPVFTDHEKPCWANKENYCPETSQECRQCDVYEKRFFVGSLKQLVDIRYKSNQEKTDEPITSTP